MTRQERNEAKMRADIERIGWHVILIPEDDRGAQRTTPVAAAHSLF